MEQIQIKITFGKHWTRKTISDMSFIQPELKYDYTALEPYIDARTMEIHYTKHHAGYTSNLNKAIEGTELDGKTIEEVLK